MLFPCLYFFDLHTGKLRTAEQVKSNLLTLMDWLDELDYPVLQIETTTIRNHLDGICNCYKKAEAIYNNLAIHFSTEILDFVGLAWQMIINPYNAKAINNAIIKWNLNFG